MKTFLQSLLIFFALCLCGLSVFQWVRETDLRADIQKLHDDIHARDEHVQQLTSDVKQDESEIQRLDGLYKSATATLKSNDVRIATLTKDLDKSNRALEVSHQESENFKTALEAANSNVKIANENIQKQKEELQKMVAQETDLVDRLKKVTSDYNELAAKWNQQQEELAKANTNAPNQKK